MRHSFSLDTGTEAAYDNYKKYDWKSSMLQFPGMCANREKWRTADNRAHTLLLVILRGNYVVNNNLLNFIFLLRCWITLKPKKELKNFSIFCSQNDRTKLKIGKIYDRSSDKYVPMTERYFDPWLLLEFMFSDFLLNALCHQNILKHILEIQRA